jgi:hypothetical protein
MRRGWVRAFWTEDVAGDCQRLTGKEAAGLPRPLDERAGRMRPLKAVDSIAQLKLFGTQTQRGMTSLLFSPLP